MSTTVCCRRSDVRVVAVHLLPVGGSLRVSCSLSFSNVHYCLLQAFRRARRGSSPAPRGRLAACELLVIVV